MTPELQSFVDHFKNEAELRSAIEGLLSKRSECEGVRSLHGADEDGKDLVFYAPAGLGKRKLNACVIKLGKITGSVSDATSGARNVLLQCDQALDSPIVNTQGHSEWVSHVYVMCPNELSPTAMQSVEGAFKGKPSQIEFICGHDLLQMFKDSWSDFIFFQPDLLSAHLEALAKELESDANIQRLATAHGLSTITKNKNIYVEPQLSQTRAKLSRGTRLPDRSLLSRLSSPREIRELTPLLASVEASMNIVDYLPPTFHKRKGAAQGDLQSWPDRLVEEWSKAYDTKASEIHKRDRLATVPTVPLPAETIENFFKSRGCRFAAEVYAELDTEIEEANTWVECAYRTELLNGDSFANYGSLLHASTLFHPTIEAASNGLIEWSAEELMDGRRNVLITGAPGFGKTSFCRNHFLADLENFRRGQSKILPLYFVAHSVALSDSTTFEEIFIRREVAARLANDASLAVRIYLDGLDEVRSTDDRDKILGIVKHACTTESTRYHCIATAREHVGGYWTNWLIRVSLSRMSSDKLMELVAAWLDGDSVLIDRFYTELRNADSLLPVLGVPLLATLTVLVFKNLHRLPENKLRLYQMFIDLLLGGWNLAKGLQRAYVFSPTVKGLLMTRLAGMMHAARLNECKRSHIVSAIKQVAPSLENRIRDVTAELVEDGLLLHTGRSSYIFPHLSFQEYLAAKDARDPSRNDEEKRIVLAYLRGDDWNKEVAHFVVSMTTNPMAMRGWVVALVKPFVSPGVLSESEKRAGFLLAKLSEMFPECRTLSPADRAS